MYTQDTFLQNFILTHLLADKSILIQIWFSKLSCKKIDALKRLENNFKYMSRLEQTYECIVIKHLKQYFDSADYIYKLGFKIYNPINFTLMICNKWNNLHRFSFWVNIFGSPLYQITKKCLSFNFTRNLNERGLKSVQKEPWYNAHTVPLFEKM